MPNKYTTNHNYHVEYTPYYGDYKGHFLYLPLCRKYKGHIFYYNRAGALKAIRDYLVSELRAPDYSRPDRAEFKVYNHNREVEKLRVAIEGTSDEAYSAALDRVEELKQ